MNKLKSSVCGTFNAGPTRSGFVLGSSQCRCSFPCRFSASPGMLACGHFRKTPVRYLSVTEVASDVLRPLTVRLDVPVALEARTCRRTGRRKGGRPRCFWMFRVQG